MRRARTWSRLLLLAAAVVGLWGMQRTVPNYNRLVAPIETRGEPGVLVRGRTVAARVDRVTLARTLRLDRFGRAHTYDTSGVWLMFARPPSWRAGDDGGRCLERWTARATSDRAALLARDICVEYSAAACRPTEISSSSCPATP